MVRQNTWQTSGIFRWVTGLIFLAIIGCSESKKPITTDLTPVDTLSLSYAKGFEITYYDNFKVLNVTNPWKGSNKNYTYILASEDLTEIPNINHDAVIRIPVNNLVCTSTSHLAMLDLIGESQRLKGFPGLDLISSQAYVDRINSNDIVDLGMEQGINIEGLMDLNPELIMAYGTGNEFDQFDSFERTRIPYVINGDYMEAEPLGRAEWVKFIAAFFDKEELADSLFKTIEQEYQNLKEAARKQPEQPTVFTGILYGDTWFLPGGNNYAAHFFRDAGARYIWENNPEDGWLELSYEVVFDNARDADFWMGVASFNTLEEMKSADHRYADFRAHENAKVYNYNNRMGPNGGNEYLETGYARPDIILKDMIHILHPGVLADHELYYYKVLP